MKKIELKTMIREIVREEVKMELRLFLKEYKQKQIRTVEKPIKKKSIKKPISKYSNNSILNEVLSETAKSDEWKTMGGKTFTTDDIGSILSKEYGNQSTENIPTSMGVDNSQVPDHVSDALTKDYRGLMKAIDKKKNGAPL
tara:strand:+ start:984 stop:1406 length:423 start_codon:yes stop_codon:yes gene_type:complete